MIKLNVITTFDVNKIIINEALLNFYMLGLFYLIIIFN